eukprot:s3768_g15.t1
MNQGGQGSCASLLAGLEKMQQQDPSTPARKAKSELREDNEPDFASCFSPETVGYSSGSAGGKVTEPSGSAPPEDPGKNPPVNPPVPGLSEPKIESKPTVDYYQEKEAAMMERLDQHMRVLTKKFEDDLLNRKRAAEQDLDMEIASKRQKRLQELDDEVRDEKTMKETHLASLDAQLAEKMQLVSDEQTILDDLKEKSKRLQRDLEAAAADQSGQTVFSTPCSKISGTSAAEKDAMKTKLKEKKCLYDQAAVKYLVLVKDDVEAGDERLKEFEQELQDMGLFDTQFSLGDLLDEDDSAETAGDPPPEKKRRLEEFPPIEGDESIAEYLGQFKKACLTRKANLKTAKERLDRDKATGHETLVSICKLNNLYNKLTEIEASSAGRSMLGLLTFNGPGLALVQLGMYRHKGVCGVLHVAEQRLGPRKSAYTVVCEQIRTELL